MTAIDHKKLLVTTNQHVLIEPYTYYYSVIFETLEGEEIYMVH